MCNHFEHPQRHCSRMGNRFTSVTRKCPNKFFYGDMGRTSFLQRCQHSVEIPLSVCIHHWWKLMRTCCHLNYYNYKTKFMNFLSYFNQMLKYFFIFSSMKRKHAIDKNRNINKGVEEASLKKTKQNTDLLTHLNILFSPRFLLLKRSVR